MDNFFVDLDKVLDDFEEHEGSAAAATNHGNTNDTQAGSLASSVDKEETSVTGNCPPVQFTADTKPCTNGAFNESSVLEESLSSTMDEQRNEQSCTPVACNGPKDDSACDTHLNPLQISHSACDSSTPFLHQDVSEKTAVGEDSVLPTNDESSVNASSPSSNPRLSDSQLPKATEDNNVVLPMVKPDLIPAEADDSHISNALCLENELNSEIHDTLVFDKQDSNCKKESSSSLDVSGMEQVNNVVPDITASTNCSIADDDSTLEAMPTSLNISTKCEDENVFVEEAPVGFDLNSKENTDVSDTEIDTYLGNGDKPINASTMEQEVQIGGETTLNLNPASNGNSPSPLDFENLQSPAMGNVVTPSEDAGFTKVPGFDDLDMGNPSTTKEYDVKQDQVLSIVTGPSVGSEVQNAISSDNTSGCCTADSIAPTEQCEEFVDKCESGCNLDTGNVKTVLHDELFDYDENIAEKTAEKISRELLPGALENIAPVDNILPINASELAKSPTGIGARPKDPAHIKRPTKLEGLCKPDLRTLVEPKDVELKLASESDLANASDMLRRQKAAGQPSSSAINTANIPPTETLSSTNLIDQVPPAPSTNDRPFTTRDQLASGIPLPANLMSPSTVMSPPEPENQDKPKNKRPSSLPISQRPSVTLSPHQTDDTPSVTSSPYSAESSDSMDPGMYVGPATAAVNAGMIPPATLASMPAPSPAPPSPQPPQCSANSNMNIMELGRVAPVWVPDNEAPNCMQCAAKFTFTKRRHHCRACGQVFCSLCCYMKCKLHYMENKDARVCSKCYTDIIRAEAFEKNNPSNASPNPNNPSEYCSTIPPHQQVQANTPPPTVMVPVGVLKKDGDGKTREPKQVMFSDGIRPGGDLTELDGSDSRVTMRSVRQARRAAAREAAKQAAREQQLLQQHSAADGSSSSLDTTSTTTCSAATTGSGAGTVTKATSGDNGTQVTVQSARASCSLIAKHGLPPVIWKSSVSGDHVFDTEPNDDEVVKHIKDLNNTQPVVFAVNRNLSVLVKMVHLDCCVDRVCWCFTTRGMCNVSQDEIVIVLEALPDEQQIPRDVFLHLQAVYEEANDGNTVSDLGHTIFGIRFGDTFLGSKEHCGFLYVRPSFQCLQQLCLPRAPYVFGILLQQWETPWAKVFPIRLMLRLGAEFRYYPCPLISVRHRKPVCGEIGHTIMNLLADFRSYQYMLPQIKGVLIYMENKQTHLLCPRNRYSDIMKVLDSANDHVMALGANFNTAADSHLVCIQNEEGNYQTQAINIQDKPRKVTGASFVVFSGALKSSARLHGKSSIVEDGLMVQLLPEKMVELKQAFRDMKDYTINCGSIDSSPEEQVLVRWVEDDKNVNIGVKSHLDGKALDGIESVRLHHATDYVGAQYMIRWTELFFLETVSYAGTPGGVSGEPVDLSRLADALASACCVALVPQLPTLYTLALTPLALRVNIHPDMPGYEIGSHGTSLPAECMTELDNKLIPILHGATAMHSAGGASVTIELLLHILEA